MRILVCYDVSDDRRRERLARVLLEHGERVQRSVFECDLSPAELARVRSRLLRLLRDEDSLRLYPLCAACRGRVEAHGSPLVPPLGADRAV